MIWIIILTTVKLIWTTPADTVSRNPLILQKCTGYVAQYQVANSAAWTNVPLKRSLSLPDIVYPGNINTPDSGYVDNPTTWRAQGITYRLKALDARGNISKPSNYVTGASDPAMPDTVFGLTLKNGANLITQVVASKSSQGNVWFNRAPNDTLPALVEHEETVNLREMSYVCAKWHYWWLRGVKQTCP